LGGSAAESSKTNQLGGGSANILRWATNYPKYYRNSGGSVVEYCRKMIENWRNSETDGGRRTADESQEVGDLPKYSGTVPEYFQNRRWSKNWAAADEIQLNKSQKFVEISTNFK
jgi:hypothetical protein